MTLRIRLTLLTVGILLLSLLTYAGVAGALLWRLELGRMGEQVGAQAHALLELQTSDPARLTAVADDVLEENGLSATARLYLGDRLRWSGGAAGPQTLDAAFLRQHELQALRTVGHYLVFSQRRGTVSVQVGRDLEPLEHLLRRYALIALGTLLGLSILVGWLVAWQVRRTLEPLEALAQRVGTLEAPGPLPATGKPDEVGALARVLDSSLSALRAEREKETLFLASASHELRTPVTAMLADLEHTLSRPRPPEELHAALARTERTASRLRGLTGNLMNLTRAQRLPYGARHAPDTDLLNLAGEAVDLLQPLAVRRDITLWLDGEAVAVRAESGLLSAVLENLIGNAIKFTPPGGEVNVHVRPTSQGAELTVQDNGPGFPEGTLTDAFVRGQTDVEGFGLGLAVVRQVVEAYRGTLELGQASGGGAKVTVTLPMTGAPAGEGSLGGVAK